MKIRIKYFTDKIDKLCYIDGKSDWIDLRAAEDVELKAGEFALIPLGVAMELPKGYEAHVVPRSSTFKNFGVIQTNHMGVIDETYCGDQDQWFFPAMSMTGSASSVLWSISLPLPSRKQKPWAMRTEADTEAQGRIKKPEGFGR